MDNLKYKFDKVNEWIKIADQKAMILGSFNIAGFIYQLVNLDQIICGSVYTIILSILSLIATFSALFFWLRVIYPKLDNKQKYSKIYFQHIANAYESDKKQTIEDLMKESNESFEKDLASQIAINSRIAKKKYADIQTFILVFGAQLLTILLLLISLM